MLSFVVWYQIVMQKCIYVLMSTEESCSMRISFNSEFGISTQIKHVTDFCYSDKSKSSVCDVGIGKN